MTERFDIWKYSDLKYVGVFEAGKDLGSNTSESMSKVGEIELDIKDIKLQSGHMPLLPLKILGKLEKISKNVTGVSKRDIHLVGINSIHIGYLVDEEDKFRFRDGSLFLNRSRRVHLTILEKAVLIKCGVPRMNEEMEPKYLGKVGQIEAENLALLPINGVEYPFSNLVFRDYFK